MLKHSRNREPQQGGHSGYDAKGDGGRGDQTADESAARTEALNPLRDYPKDQAPKKQKEPRQRRAT